MEYKLDLLITKFVSKENGIAMVKIDKILSPQVNVDEFNFDTSTESMDNIRCILRYSSGIKIFQIHFANSLDSFDIEENQEYTKKYFDMVMKYAKTAIENYNKWEKEHANERAEMLKNWNGSEHIIVI